VQPLTDALPVPIGAKPVPAAMQPVGEITPCDGTRIIARVGSDAIFESEAAGAVNEVIEKNKDRIPADQLDKQRDLLIQQRLKGLIETKLIFQDARRTIPAEGWSHIEKQLSTRFDEVELEKLMAKAEVKTAREFDGKLRVLGTSLDREKRAFIERSLAQEWVHQQIKRDEEITYDQMLVYYREHQKEFTTFARARWEELMVRYAKYPTKAAAFDAIARMGNQAFAGASLADVAKAASDGTTADSGGQWPWTSKGALTCRELDEALFRLPIGRMSPIIAGEKGYHIIRVIEREDEVVRSFLEAQVDIKKKIIEQRTQKQFRDYMAGLEKRIPVWTIFDDRHATEQLATPRQPTRR
jgi:parvulin-like peptidyl-prolyl isomerase